MYGGTSQIIDSDVSLVVKVVVVNQQLILYFHGITRFHIDIKAYFFTFKIQTQVYWI